MSDVLSVTSQPPALWLHHGCVVSMSAAGISWPVPRLHVSCCKLNIVSHPPKLLPWRAGWRTRR